MSYLRRVDMSSDKYIRFASPEQIQRWRAFSLLNGWTVQGSIDTYPSEIRLFDAPIVMHPLAPYNAPLRRLVTVACVPMKIPQLAPLNIKHMTIHNGWVYATDSRFIVRRTLGNDTDIIIPYSSIIDVRYEEKSAGMRSFYIQLDPRVVISDIRNRMPVPENIDGLSVEEFSERVMIPYAQELSRQAVAAFGITVKAPKAGFWEAIAILTTNNPWEREWLTDASLRANEMGSDFVAAFFYFLNEIADKNRLA